MTGLPNTLRMVLKIIALSFLALVLLSIALAVIGTQDKIQKADVTVVLGNKVRRDGKPSARLAARLDTAIALYRQGMFPTILVSGGIDPNGLDEASVMGNYLIQHGVPKSAVIIDSLGVNTAATAKNTAVLAKAHNWSSVMVISQYFHIPRSRLAMSRVGFKNIYSAHAHYFEWRDLYSTPREVIGYVAYLAGARN